MTLRKNRIGVLLVPWLVLFAIWLFWYFQEASEKKSFTLSVQSDELLRKGNYTEAEKLIDEALRIYPENYVAYNNQGYIYAKYYDNHKLALRSYRQALRINPNYEVAFKNVIVEYFRVNDYGNVVSEYDLFEERFGQDLNLLFHKAESLNYLEKYSEALDYFDTIVKSDSLNPYVLKERSHANEKLGNYIQSLKDAQLAVSLDRKYKQGFNRLGIIFERMDSFEQALSSYSKAVELDSNSHIYLFNRGYVKLIGFHNVYEACKDFREADRLGSELAKGYIEKFCHSREENK